MHNNTNKVDYVFPYHFTYCKYEQYMYACQANLLWSIVFEKLWTYLHKLFCLICILHQHSVLWTHFKPNCSTKICQTQETDLPLEGEKAYTFSGRQVKDQGHTQRFKVKPCWHYILWTAWQVLTKLCVHTQFMSLTTQLDFGQKLSVWWMMKDTFFSQQPWQIKTSFVFRDVQQIISFMGVFICRNHSMLLLRGDAPLCPSFRHWNTSTLEDGTLQFCRIKIRDGTYWFLVSRYTLKVKGQENLFVNIFAYIFTSYIVFKIVVHNKI